MHNLFLSKGHIANLPFVCMLHFVDFHKCRCIDILPVIHVMLVTNTKRTQEGSFMRKTEWTLPLLASPRK